MEREREREKDRKKERKERKKEFYSRVMGCVLRQSLHSPGAFALRLRTCFSLGSDSELGTELGAGPEVRCKFVRSSVVFVSYDVGACLKHLLNIDLGARRCKTGWSVGGKRHHRPPRRHGLQRNRGRLDRTPRPLSQLRWFRRSGPAIGGVWVMSGDHGGSRWILGDLGYLGRQFDVSFVCHSFGMFLGSMELDVAVWDAHGLFRTPLVMRRDGLTACPDSAQIDKFTAVTGGSGST